MVIFEIRKFVGIAMFAFAISLASCATDCKSVTCKNFEDTEMYELAVAAANNDFVQFDKIVDEKKFSLTSSQGKYKRSFIFCLMRDDNYSLLEHVLNSKELKIDLNSIRPLILNGCMGMEFEKDNGLKYYELFLSHGADPNLVVDGDGAYGNLLDIKDFNRVSKIIDVLLKYGWDMNNDELFQVPLEGAVQNIRLVKYLIDKGADWHKPFKYKIFGDVDRIWKMSRHWVPPLNSEEHQIKMELIKLFESDGYNYSTDPIPSETMDFINRKYPDEKERLEYIKYY